LRTQTIGSHHEYLFGGCLRQTVTGAPAGTLTAASASANALGQWRKEWLS